MAKPSETYYAAVDLGSNSFHMAIAKLDGQSFQIIGKLKEKIQLAKGLDSNGFLSEEAMNRGLDCLRLFAERLKNIPNQQVKIVATYTLRKAVNAKDFIEQAEQILSLPIEILPGKEEARLIYNGVSHNHPDIEKALVIDIGGGSTEVILGNQFEHLSLDSLSLGCVTYNKYFKDNVINESNFQDALLNAVLAIAPIKKQYSSKNWQHCIGSSGSIEAVHNVIQGFGFNDSTIKYEHLLLIKSKLIEIGNIELVTLDGLSNSRVNTFTSGLVLLMALFQTLNIQEMYISNASLREGILLELADELKGNDNRNTTVSNLENRFNIDKAHANNVKQVAQLIFDEVADEWAIYDSHYKNLLDWSCHLHEIGLSISYSKMRFHSSHIVQYADMPGFSLQTKESLAVILKAQNKKLNHLDFENRFETKNELIAICQVLRLAILLNITREKNDLSSIEFLPETDNKLTIKATEQWINQNQLIMLELRKESEYLGANQIILEIDTY